MDWKTLLAYITGTVAQELLLRNEYLVTEIGYSATRSRGVDNSAMASARPWRQSARSLGSKPSRKWPTSSNPTP